jgi:hypothetical protein
LADLGNRWLGPAVRTGSITVGHELVAWVHSSIYLPWVGSLLLFVLLVFPNGRLLSGAWRPVAWLVVAAAVTGALAAGIEPGTLFWYPAFRNPFAVGDSSSVGYVLIRVVAVSSTIGATALAAYGLIIRYRGGDTDRRRQLKWIAYAGVILAVIAAPYAVARLVWPASPINGMLVPAVLIAATLVPVATAVAIMRYRLYAIDVLVNRTLAAAILAGLVAALFGVVSTVLQRLSIGLGGDESELALIVSTLIVATLIGPIGRVVDRFIEQRLNPETTRLATVGGPSASTLPDRSPDQVLNELADLRQRLANLERLVTGDAAPSTKPRRSRARRASMRRDD